MESTQKQIKLDDSIRYTTFMSMLEYLYTGKGPEIDCNNNDNSILKIVELLRLSDQYMLDHLKQICECKLGSVVNDMNVDSILEHSELFNAEQLAQFCRHYKRNFCFSKSSYNYDNSHNENDDSVSRNDVGNENNLEEWSKRK